MKIQFNPDLIYQYNGVLYEHACQTHKAQHCHEPKWLLEHQQPRRNTDECKRYDKPYDQGLFERIEQSDDDEYHQSEEHWSCLGDSGRTLVGIFIFTSPRHVISGLVFDIESISKLQWNGRAVVFYLSILCDT